MSRQLGHSLLCATLSLIIPCCADEADESGDSSSTGDAAQSTSTSNPSPSSSDAEDGGWSSFPDVRTDPYGTQVTATVDEFGCFPECFSNAMANIPLVTPSCTVEFQADSGSPADIPPCDGTSPDDFAVPSGATACYWFRRDHEEYDLTPDDERDDIPDECLPTNAAFAFVEATEGVLSDGEIVATCWALPDPFAPLILCE